MTELSRRTIVSEPVYWDNAQWSPDAVFLALGTNDQNHDNGTAWEAGFASAYADFLVGLTAAHGPVPIFAVVGPITHRYFPWVAAGVAMGERRGATHTKIINWTSPVDRCGHPDWDAHAAFYEQLVPVVSAALGW